MAKSVFPNLLVELFLIPEKHSKVIFSYFQKLDSFQKEHVELCSEKEKLSEEIRTCEDQIEAIKTEINNLDEKISQYHLLKHKVQFFILQLKQFTAFEVTLTNDFCSSEFGSTDS